MHCNTVRRTSSDSPASIEKILNLFNRVLVRSTVLDFGGSTGSTQLSPGRVSLRSLLPKSAVLDYWRFTSFVFRYDFAKAKSALHQLVHRDVSRRLCRRRTCQNPQKKSGRMTAKIFLICPCPYNQANHGLINLFFILF